MIEILLLIISIGTLAIWYEIRFGIEKRHELKKRKKEYGKELKTKWQEDWQEFSEAREDSKKWEEYLKKNKSL